MTQPTTKCLPPLGLCNAMCAAIRAKHEDRTWWLIVQQFRWSGSGPAYVVSTMAGPPVRKLSSERPDMPPPD